MENEMSGVIEINNFQEFEDFKKNKKGVIFYGAEWCEGCKEVEGIYSRIATRYQDHIKMAHVDVEKVNLDFTAVPVFVAYHNGKAINSILGGSVSRLKELVKDAIKVDNVEVREITKQLSPEIKEFHEKAIAIPKQPKANKIQPMEFKTSTKQGIREHQCKDPNCKENNNKEFDVDEFKNKEFKNKEFKNKEFKNKEFKDKEFKDKESNFKEFKGKELNLKEFKSNESKIFNKQTKPTFKNITKNLSYHNENDDIIKQSVKVKTLTKQPSKSKKIHLEMNAM